MFGQGFDQGFRGRGQKHKLYCTVPPGLKEKYTKNTIQLLTSPLNHVKDFLKSLQSAFLVITRDHEVSLGASRTLLSPPGPPKTLEKQIV